MHTSDGTDLAVHDFGGSGDDLLVVHGAGLCATMFAPMAEVLGNDYKTSGLDLRGHGSSTRPPHRDYTWSRFGRDVREFLDNTQNPLRIFGHSLGASAVLLAALDRPDAISSLCLYEPIILDVKDVTGTEKMAQRTEGRRAVFASRAEIEQHFSSRGLFVNLDQAALAGYVEGGFRRQPDGSFVLALAPIDEAAIYRGTAAPGLWTGLDALPDLDLEITVFIGSTSTGPMLIGARRLADLDERISVVEVPDVGHFGPFEAPALVAEMVSTTFDLLLG